MIRKRSGVQPRTGFTVVFIGVGIMLAVLLAMGSSLPSAQSTLAPDVVTKLSQARVATAKYATDVEQAKADGYMIISPMIPNMGYHFLNPKIEGFDVTKPPILVYVRKGDAWQLVAIEWAWPRGPDTALRAPDTDLGQLVILDGSFVRPTLRPSAPRTTASGAEFTFGIRRS
jgi:hypothetical protein